MSADQSRQDAGAVGIWLRALAGAPPRLELPARGAAGGAAASAERTIDAALCERLAQGRPLAAVMLASLWVLVARHTGQDDIVALVGGAAWQAPARGRLEDDPSFTELVARADAAIVEAERWPVDIAALDEGLARAGQALAWQVSLRWVEGAAEGCSLAVELRTTPDGLRIGLRGDPSLFDAETLRGWLMRWETLLRGAAQRPERPVSTLPLLTAQERAAAAAAWNDTARTLSDDVCVYSLVEAQIARTPDAIAVISEEGQLSYAELGARVSRLAATLRRRGVGPEVLVAICAERSLALIVGLLAIVRAGGAFAPLDPEHPRDRLAYMLADTGVTLLLAQRGLVAGLPAFAGEVLLLDEADPQGEDAVEEAAVSAENLLYVLYTSGSTGRPKGAMNIHRGVVNRLLDLQRIDPLGPDDRVLQKSSCGFDISVYEYFWPLLAGATLVMARPGGHRDPGYLLEVIRERAITTVHFVPPMLAVFLEQADLSGCASLRRVLCSGDVLPAAVAQRCLLRLNVELYNLYGPTETAIEMTMYRCRRGEACVLVPIGQALANSTVYLLDRHGEPVPPGAPGELFIGGAQVGRGYLGRPELTAASFVPDPFSQVEGARMYRSGDVGRRRPDGEIEFLGRRDHQAKIRGVRVELGEIEAMLREHPEVRDVVVVVSQAAGGDKQLAAYVVANEGAAIEATGLHAWASERLPVYMVPGAFMVLERFPLSSNGKLDRRALPPAVACRPVTGVSPRTGTERAVAALWCEVLGIEGCGVDDDLLMLGGHSLHAAQLLGRVRDGFAVELAFPEIFAHPTIAGLARLIDERRGAAMVEARATAVAEALSPAEERLLFLHGLAPESPAYHCPSVFRVRGPFAPAHVEAAVRAVVARHEVLRARFVEVDGEARRLTAADESFEFTTVELPGASTDELLRHLSAEVARPFDLGSAPPIRAGIVRVAADDHVLWINLHHIVTDGRSTAILLREISAVYGGLCAGAAPALPGPKLRHAEVVALQRAALAGEAPRIERWKQRLAGVHRLELPVDGAQQPTWRGGQVGFEISAGQFEQLRALARRRGATPSMAILAVVAAWLRRLTGQDDRVIALIAAARGRSALQDVVGFLVDTLPIRVELAGEAGFLALLDHVRARALEAQDGEHVPLERIVQALALPREAGRDPLIQVALAPQPAGERELRLAGATVEPIAVDRGASIFDLTILTWEAADGGLEVVFEYASDLFSRARAGSMARSFAAVFAAAVAAPELPVVDLAMVSANERAALLTASKGPEPARERVGGVHAYFEWQVERTPDATAVIDGARSLSYGALERRANRMANALRARGVGRDARVGIVSERDIDSVVAVLAVLKAGAAYVPLDPGYPQQRLACIVEDAAPRWILASAAGAARLPVHGAEVLPLDADSPLYADCGEARPEAFVRAEDLAYVLFTSGSTGRPKGVAMGHGALCNLVEWHIEHPRLGRSARTLQFASLNFDVSAQELLTTWATGGALVLVGEDTRRDVLALLGVLEEQGVERVYLPFVALQHLAEAASSIGRAPAGLLDVITAGEQLTITPAIRWLFTRLAACVLHNHYGPTESHVVTAHSLAGPPEAWPTLPPIGRPIDHTRIHVLDAGLEPVPAGVAGELFIAGAALARGYLGRPELTAERFVADPFVAGATMYRTGDRARRGEAGDIEYLGRVDRQVKLRGVRVELGEVEAVLAGHPGVRAAVAAVREDVAGDRRLIAYVLTRDGAPADAAALRAHLRAQVPEAMIPAAFVTLDRLPLLPSGKLDRDALPAPEGEAQARRGEAPTSAAERALAAIWAEVLETRAERIGLDDAFFDLGGHSLLLARVRAAIAARLGVELRIVDLFRCPTIRSLAALLRGSEPTAAPVERPRGEGPAIAIVGMSGRFPGAADVDALWQLLCEGREGISRFTAAEMEAAGVEPALLRSPRWVPATGVLTEPMAFDAAFFGYSASEARTMDPQHRVFLECAWSALESAGYAPRGFAGAVGVFGGSDVPRYWIERIGATGAALSMEEYAVSFANMSDTLATRVAYELGLRGPALTVQTACSTSLVAVHLACQSLRAGECDMALAGGVVVLPTDRLGYLSEGGSVVSPDGHCRPFDADARGMVSSSGAGLVVLRRLADAVADGDTIHAVLHGTAINNDGAQKVGFTAPSVEGQAGAISRALAMAGFDAATIGYVEAHGTATRLGDPIEVAALTRAYRAHTELRGYCALGSIKSNLGHLGVAAGVAGLIKAALCLANERIPPTLHFVRPNPELELESSPFHVNARTLAWPRGATPRRAGVSAFGVGGTNAHAVLEEAPAVAAAGPSRAAQLLVISARTAGSLDAVTQRLASVWTAGGPDLADAAFTLARGRQAFVRRRIVVARDGQAAAEALRRGDRAWVAEGVAPGRAPPVAFLFPGGGTQSVGMGRELYAGEAVYREAFDRAAAGFDAALGIDVRGLLFAGDPAAAAEALRRPTRNIAAIYCTQYALARLLGSFGVIPTAVTGHSLGEYAAATVAGILTVEDAVRLLVERGQIHEALPADAALLIVATGEARLLEMLGDDLDLAAVNAEDSCVVAGSGAALDRLAARLRERSIEHKRLPVSGASHCALVEPFLDRLHACAAGVRRSAPSIPIVSNLSGDWLSEAEATDASHWPRHLRGTVRFAQGIARLLADPQQVLVEVGPGRTLAGLTRRAAPMRPVITTLASTDGRRTALEDVLLALGQLWCAGVEIDWDAYYSGERRRRVPLPTYAFERVHHEHPVAARRGVAPGEPPRVMQVPAPVRARAHAVASDPALEVLRELFASMLGAESARPDDHFFDLGGSSFMALRMRVQIEERLGVRLPVHAFVESPTLAGLAERVRSALAPAQTGPVEAAGGRLLVPLRAGRGGPELAMIQPIGGTVFTYRGLARHIDPAYTITGVRASGMEPGEPVLASVEAIAARYLEELADRDVPALCGHSAGGVLAFEMARQLRARGGSAPLVVLLDTPPLTVARGLVLTDDEDTLKIAEMMRSEGSEAHAEFARALREDASFREIVRVTWRALAAHEPAPAELDVLYVQARASGPEGGDRAWMDLCGGSFTRVSVDADHFTMMDDPTVATLARHIERAIEPRRRG